MSTLHFFKSSDGAPRAHGENLAMLAQFLESDIQDDIEHCQALLNSIEKQLLNNTEHPYEFIGNSFELIVSDAHCTLTNSQTDEEAQFSTLTITCALDDWKNFLKQ